MEMKTKLLEEGKEAKREYDCCDRSKSSGERYKQHLELFKEPNVMLTILVQYNTTITII